MLWRKLCPGDHGPGVPLFLSCQNTELPLVSPCFKIKMSWSSPFSPDISLSPFPSKGAWPQERRKAPAQILPGHSLSSISTCSTIARCVPGPASWASVPGQPWCLPCLPTPHSSECSFLTGHNQEPVPALGKRAACRLLNSAG